MKKILLSFVILIVFTISCSTETTIGSEIGFRKQTMQGKYYPADKDSLANLIDRFADTTTMGTNGMSGFFLNYIVLPHGKMEYFMQNAKDPLRAITGYDFETFVLITDCNKDDKLETFDIYDGEGYASTFGNIKVDTAIRNSLKKEFPENCSVDFQNDQEYNRFEPYINVMAKLVPDKKIVPIVIGKADKYQINDFAQKIDNILKAAKKNVLVVVVTNLSENVNHDRARDTDVPLIKKLEVGNVFTLFRDDYEGYDNELRALQTTAVLGQYGGANTFLPYLYNTSFNVFEREEEFNSVQAYLAALSYSDSHLAYVSFSPFKKMESMAEFADTVNSAFKQGLMGQASPKGMIVMREFQKPFPYYMTVKMDGEMIAHKGDMLNDLNMIFTPHIIANGIALNHPKKEQLLKKFDDLYMGMYICNYPRVIKAFPSSGKFNKTGFGLLSDKGETFILPDLDFPSSAEPKEIEDTLYKKAGISKDDKHILYMFDIFILEKNAPKE